MRLACVAVRGELAGLVRVRVRQKLKAYSFREVVEFHQTFECGGDDGATASQSLHMRQENKQAMEKMR